MDPSGFAMSPLWSRPCRVPPFKRDMQKTCRNIGWSASWSCSRSLRVTKCDPQCAPGRQHVAYVATFAPTATCKFLRKNKVRAAWGPPGDFCELCSAYFSLAWSAFCLCFDARAAKSKCTGANDSVSLALRAIPKVETTMV